ncbi:hypothetical protein PR048_002250 [Dryococelus australis]|uniref:PiggyBac transposable element-derived protein domain-containing protein n=1 Tax=Dryococelus australis TaxID=614101 RepID=A0ABQ9IL26_9NEOP|nr:hypothetical protein PR048_002250 [Dryococelus australis]
MEVYVGNQSDEPYKVSNSPTDAVKRLVQGIEGSGRNIACDNLFCRVPPATELLKKNLTIVGTMQKNKREIPRMLRSNSTESSNQNELLSLEEAHGTTVIYRIRLFVEDANDNAVNNPSEKDSQEPTEDIHVHIRRGVCYGKPSPRCVSSCSLNYGEWLIIRYVEVSSARCQLSPVAAGLVCLVAVRCKPYSSDSSRRSSMGRGLESALALGLVHLFRSTCVDTQLLHHAHLRASDAEVVRGLADHRPRPRSSQEASDLGGPQPAPGSLHRCPRMFAFDAVFTDHDSQVGCPELQPVPYQGRLTPCRPFTLEKIETPITWCKFPLKDAAQHSPGEQWEVGNEDGPPGNRPPPPLETESIVNIGNSRLPCLNSQYICTALKELACEATMSPVAAMFALSQKSCDPYVPYTEHFLRAYKNLFQYCKTPFAPLPQVFSRTKGAAVAERLDCSHPTKANRVQSPAWSLPDFRKWESCWTMPLVGGISRFSRESPFSSALAFRHCLISPSSALETSLINAVVFTPKLLENNRDLTCTAWLSSQADVCSNSLTDAIHAVINGTDGCLFCFGAPAAGSGTGVPGDPAAILDSGLSALSSRSRDRHLGFHHVVAKSLQQKRLRNAIESSVDDTPGVPDGSAVVMSEGARTLDEDVFIERNIAPADELLSNIFVLGVGTEMPELQK